MTQDELIRHAFTEGFNSGLVATDRHGEQLATAEEAYQEFAAALASSVSVAGPRVEVERQGWKLALEPKVASLVAGRQQEDTYEMPNPRQPLTPAQPGSRDTDQPDVRRLREQLIVCICSENNWHHATVDALILAVRADALREQD